MQSTRYTLHVGHSSTQPLVPELHSDEQVLAAVREALACVELYSFTATQGVGVWAVSPGKTLVERSTTVVIYTTAPFATVRDAASILAHLLGQDEVLVTADVVTLESVPSPFPPIVAEELRKLGAAADPIRVVCKNFGLNLGEPAGNNGQG